ncbi:MAG: hypothetical protein ALECFALPRED_009624 [Alectoria fallacina]|uniref:F-box domain-containing protein n=1 Tax=Alectoria fallacina TaxID=1903189 RepID=A0A8H3J7M4_9LECA|nr:MAG: hypothetical protein ALECFALPRED_009624 [Alectoria fallacina]
MSLPNELVLETLQYLKNLDLKSARLVSKLWSGCAAEHLFTKLFISPHKLNLQIFAAVLRDPMLSRCVKELEYDAIDFSPHTTISEYLEILWCKTSMIASAPEYNCRSPDPQIHHLVTMLKHRREHWARSQEIMAEAQTECCHFTFVQEGYRNWMDQAAFQKKCSEEDILLKLLIPGLRGFPRLRTVKLSCVWPYKRKLSREGSPLARSWHPFHAHPGDWILGDDQSPRQPSLSKDFWTLASALSEAGNTKIRNLSIESTLPPAAFVTKPEETQTHVDCGVASYSRLEDLKLSLAGYLDQPKVKLYDNLHGLHRLLESMAALKRFELDLPDDCVNEPVVFFPYRLIFPEDGLWPQLTTFTVRNLAIGTKDLITLLTTKMPSLRHLTFGNINLLDGLWDGIIEYLRVANGLASFEIESESLLLHRGNENYVLQQTGSGGSRKFYRDYYDVHNSIGDYIINWWSNPTLRHPSMMPGPPAQFSLDYLHDVYRLCEMPDMGDTQDQLVRHMLSEVVRYRKWQEAWARKDWLEDLPVGPQERSVAKLLLTPGTATQQRVEARKSRLASIARSQEQSLMLLEIEG